MKSICASFQKGDSDSGGGGGSCGVRVKSLACEVMALHDVGNIYLLTDNAALNPLGSGDGADSYSNIADVCYGGQAQRSS